jgi:hypothetical protein
MLLYVHRPVLNFLLVSPFCRYNSNDTSFDYGNAVFLSLDSDILEKKRQAEQVIPEPLRATDSTDFSEVERAFTKIMPPTFELHVWHVVLTKERTYPSKQPEPGPKVFVITTRGGMPQ